MKKLIVIASVLFAVSANAQTKFFTKTGKVSFDATSATSPEQIRGLNDKATSIIDVSTGAIEFAIAMKAFSFEKALMQEHFNENYVESDKFPKATFKGNVTNMKEVNLSKDGSYPVTVKGSMLLHGVTKEVDATGTLVVKGGAVVAGKSDFKILLSDFNVEVPSLVRDKVSKEAKIKVDVAYEPLKTS